MTIRKSTCHHTNYTEVVEWLICDIEEGKTHCGFSYSPASSLDFGLYVQTRWG